MPRSFLVKKNAERKGTAHRNQLEKVKRTGKSKFGTRLDLHLLNVTSVIVRSAISSSTKRLVLVLSCGMLFALSFFLLVNVCAFI